MSSTINGLVVLFSDPEYHKLRYISMLFLSVSLIDPILYEISSGLKLLTVFNGSFSWISLILIFGKQRFKSLNLFKLGNLFFRNVPDSEN